MMTLQPVLAFAWNPAVGIPLLIVGLIVLALIWLFGQPKKEQGKRRPVQSEHVGERREPTLGDQPSLADDPVFSALDRPGHAGHHAEVSQPEQGELEVGLREELERLGATLSGERHGTPSKQATPDQPPSNRPPLAGHAASIVDALRAPSIEIGRAHV